MAKISLFHTGILLKRRNFVDCEKRNAKHAKIRTCKNLVTHGRSDYE